MRSCNIAILVLASLGIAACSNTSGSVSTVCESVTTTSAERPTGWRGTVFTIVMENHSSGEILGNPDAPYINQLARANAVAAGYHDTFVHPSEPNYLWMVAGENFGILNDNDPGPSNHIDSRSHIADQIEAAGLTWKSYQQSMGEPCGLSSHGEYATKHNPFLFFDDINGWNGSSLVVTPRCQAHVVDYSELAKDLAAGSVPDYAFITPDLVHDMHDGSVAEADAWLQQEVPAILESDAFKKGGVLFLMWDEGGGLPATDDPPFIAISPNAKPGYVSHEDYDTSSYLKTVQAMLGVQALPCGGTQSNVAVMSDLFSTPMK